MNTLTAFVLGLLAGWIIEWVIDWVVWRRRSASLERQLERANTRLSEDTDFRASESQRFELENQLATLKADHAALQEKVAALEAEKAQPAEMEMTRKVDTPVVPDDLMVIKGIGPVIARKLNEAGIVTFAQLGALTAEQLRSIVGDMVQRLADEDDILDQARKLAAQPDETASL